MGTNSSLDKKNGYTVVEVVVVISVLAILIAASWVAGPSYFAYLERSRDTERASDVNGIARLFERYYRTNASVSGPSYPTISQVESDLGSLLDGTSRDVVRAPGQKTDSLVAATSSSPSQSPSQNQYIYQPLTTDDQLCSAAPCVRFNLYYLSEETGLPVAIESRRQQ